MKSNQEHSAFIIGMKFNGLNGANNWVWGYPYAWLYDLENGQYYLCKFFTPWPWSDFCPWIIKKRPHKIWKVDERVVNKPCFNYISPAEQKENSDSISKSMALYPIVSVPLGLMLAVFLEKAPDMFFSTTNKLSLRDSDFLQIVTCLSLCLILFIIIKITVVIFRKVARKGFQGKENMFQVMNKIKNNSKPQMIYVTKFHIPIFTMLFKYFFIIIGIVILFDYLNSYSPSGPYSSAESVDTGIFMFFILIVLVILPLLKKPIHPYNNPSVEIKFRKRGFYEK